ncbi:MAG: hypothetical protein K8S98_02345 [Planctomycetes bacterium]|nr:hypothetical protein [Planctomycetota bacterium]
MRSHLRRSATIALLGLAACGGSGSSHSTPPPATTLHAVVLGANDLGMHCMDREYSIFSILPPFNVVRAQVVLQTQSSKPVLLDDSQVEVVYQAVADPKGSRNSTSLGKTDFWSHANALFGATLAPGEGLTGLFMPADAPVPGPQALTFDAPTRSWIARGIPITPVDDASQVNAFPTLRLVARDKLTHNTVAFLDVVVPVAQETDCSNCHATGSLAATDPQIMWSNDSDLERQTKQNVLRLHDARSATALVGAEPVLCAGCHYSAALDLSGVGPQGSQVGHATMSAAMHAFHGKQLDVQGHPVFPPGGDVFATCYQCHPGAVTQCLRGAMTNGSVVCANCHGDMLSVGGETPLLAGGSLDGSHDGLARRPWTDLPRCQSCHTGDALSHLTGANLVAAPDGIRLRQAYRVNDASASPLLATNKRFAENTDTLYRFSYGHGGLACEDCHGSTHAEWPNANPLANDNLTATELQGHAGVLSECRTCHPTGTLPSHTLLGPHGMHVVNDSRFFDGGHASLYEQNPSACKACHGPNLSGSVLSRASADRTFNTEEGTHKVKKGAQVSCSLCHSKP